MPVGPEGETARQDEHKGIRKRNEETKKKADGSEPMNLIKWSMTCSGECWSQKNLINMMLYFTCGTLNNTYEK